MDVDSLPVHAFEAKSKVDELIVEGVDDSLGSDGIAACRAIELRSFGRTISLEQFEPVFGIPMGVSIDGAGSASGRRRGLL